MSGEADGKPGGEAGGRVHRIAFVLLLAACAFLAARGWEKAQRPQGSDLTIYLDAGRAMLAGTDPYDVERYLYPTSFAALVAPLAGLPLGVAIAVWQILSLAAVVQSARLAAGLCTPLGRASPPWLVWLPLLVVLRLVDSNLANGQVNAITLLACLYALRELRAGRARRAGLWIGLGAAIKVLPAILLLHAALRGRWSAVASGLGTIFLLVVLVPSGFLGFEGNVRALGTWGERVLAPHARGGAAMLEEREHVPGQSLYAAAHRLLTDVPATSRGAEWGTVNLVSLEPRHVDVLVRAVSALMGLALIVTVSRRPAPPASRAWGSEGALVLLTPLLVAPMIHKAHMVWALLGFAAVLAGAPAGCGRSWRILRAAGIGASALAIAATTPALVGRAQGTLLLSLNAVCLGVALLWLVLLVDRWQERSDSEPAQSLPT